MIVAAWSAFHAALSLYKNARPLGPNSRKIAVNRYNAAMHKFVRALITEWRRLELPFEGATFVVAVSGGADSVSLLLGLEELNRAKKLQNRTVAAHFNHRLRGDESAVDEEYVKQLAARLKVELSVGHASPLSAGNIEQNARIARYEFL